MCLHILCSQYYTLPSLFPSERHYRVCVFAKAAPPLDVYPGTSFRSSVIIHAVLGDADCPARHEHSITHTYAQRWRVDLPHCQVQLTATAASACPLCLVKINLPTNFLIKFHHNPWGVIGSVHSTVWCCDVRLLQWGAVIQLASCERKKNDPSAFPAVC